MTPFTILMLIFAFLYLYLLFHVVLIGTLIQKNKYRIPMCSCFIVAMVGIIFPWRSFIGNDLYILSAIALLGLPVIYFFSFREKERKTMIDYLKYCFLVVFTISFIFQDIVLNPYNAKNETGINSYLSKGIGILLFTLITVIYILIMRDRHKKRHLYEII